VTGSFYPFQTFDALGWTRVAAGVGGDLYQLRRTLTEEFCEQPFYEVGEEESRAAFGGG
jgi:hypothetical protein